MEFGKSSCCGAKGVVVVGCQSVGRGLLLEDTRDYEIRTRDEGVNERGSTRKGKAHQGSG